VTGVQTCALPILVTKWVIAGDGTLAGYAGMPPLFAAGVRFALTALVLFPLLRPIPREFGGIVLIGLTFGSLHFGLLYWGLTFASPSTVAVTIQLGVPFTTVLSILLLHEKVGPLRVAGILLAFVGVAVIAFDPTEAEFSFGLLYVAAAAFMGALGSILVKRRAEPIGAVRLQAWVGLIAAPPLLLASGLAEQGQMLGVMSGGWALAGAMAFIVLIVSIAAHGGFVVLLRRYDASLISPMTLMAPLWGMTFGVLLMGDPVSARFLIGGGLAIGGVAMVALLTGRRAMAAVGVPGEAARMAKEAQVDAARADGETE